MVDDGERFTVYLEPDCRNGLRIPLFEGSQRFGTKRYEEVLNEA
jgi:hypothetical protein